MRAPAARRRLAVRAPLAAMLALAAGCGGGDVEPTPRAQTPTATPSATPKPRPPAPLRAPRCRPEVPDCARVSGRIVYVERVDPDGDGDAHFVLADTAGVTGTGITVVDVPPNLRPQPLPGVGDHLSAAGPLETGSYGQRQVAAVAGGG